MGNATASAAGIGTVDTGVLDAIAPEMADLSYEQRVELMGLLIATRRTMEENDMEMLGVAEVDPSTRSCIVVGISREASTTSNTAVILGLTRLDEAVYANAEDDPFAVEDYRRLSRCRQMAFSLFDLKQTGAASVSTARIFPKMVPSGEGPITSCYFTPIVGKALGEETVPVCEELQLFFEGNSLSLARRHGWKMLYRETVDPLVASSFCDLNTYMVYETNEGELVVCFTAGGVDGFPAVHLGYFDEARSLEVLERCSKACRELYGMPCKKAYIVLHSCRLEDEQIAIRVETKSFEDTD